MKAIFLATMMTLALLALVTVVLRRGHDAQRARHMTILYFFCLVALTGLWLATPANLGVLASSLLVEPPWLDFLATLFFFSAAYFGGVLQLYNLADRGYSLRILIDILENPEGPADTGRLMACYSRGQGIEWMYRKRIDDLKAARLVRASGASVLLTPRGAAVAAVFDALRRFLRVDPDALRECGRTVQ